MGSLKNGTVIAAWLITVGCALMIFGLIGVPLITGTRDPMRSMGALFVAFFFSLPVAFFAIAREVRQLRDENRDLRERLDAAVGGNHRHGPTGQS